MLPLVGMMNFVLVVVQTKTKKKLGEIKRIANVKNAEKKARIEIQQKVASIIENASLVEEELEQQEFSLDEQIEKIPEAKKLVEEMLESKGLGSSKKRKASASGSKGLRNSKLSRNSDSRRGSCKIYVKKRKNNNTT